MPRKIEVTYEDGAIDLFTLTEDIVDAPAFEYNNDGYFYIFDNGRILIQKSTVKSIVFYDDVEEPEVEETEDVDVDEEEASLREYDRLIEAIEKLEKTIDRYTKRYELFRNPNPTDTWTHKHWASGGIVTYPKTDTLVVNVMGADGADASSVAEAVQKNLSDYFEGSREAVASLGECNCESDSGDACPRHPNGYYI